MGIASGYPQLVDITGEWSVTEDNRTDRQYVVEWDVKTTDPDNDWVVTVLSASGIPSYGDGYSYGAESDSYCRCRGLKAWRPDKRNHPDIWVVQARFGRLGRPADEPADPTKPWTRTVKWSIQQSDYLVECLTDINGDPIENSAGQPYDPPLEKDDAHTLIDVTYYKQTLKLSKLEQFRKAINVASHWGFSAKRLRINSLVAEEQYENGLYYWEIHAQLESNEVDWTVTRVDQGSFYLDGSGSGALLKLVKDEADVTHTFPMALDGAGGILAAGATLIEREHEVYEEEDFTDADIALPSFPTHLTYS